MATPPLPTVPILRDLDAAGLRLDAIAARTSDGQSQLAREQVDGILDRVRRQGDRALLELTEQFDGVRPDPLRIPADALATAWQQCPDPLREALKLAHRRILDFHQRQKPQDISVVGVHGERLGRRWRPVQRAGLYIPGGRAAYPSTVLMNAVPAKVAGVGRVVIVTPPGAGGMPNPTVLAAAHLAGVDEVYRVGGAQAIGALAYGTASIPAVDVISGPGNLYVTLAKKAVYGRVGIDSLAGPSEVLVIADHTADPDQVAADLLAQAEHDPLAAAILLSTSSALAEAVPLALEAQLKSHPRAAVCRAALQDWGLIVVCPNLEAAAGLSDRFAPEHLELLVERPEPMAERIQHAGAIFLGGWSPEAVGDYLAGPNHTLPTSGTARFGSALGVETFLRNTSLIQFNRRALEATGPAVLTLAESEGLHSHAESVRLRLSASADPAPAVHHRRSPPPAPGR
ncbi:histidinol dehydrogenase [Synechococcus sp. CS-1324]|uniref:histidinol dehydrogenase n=1 Tax=Synechococcus sp. CS-1324 TaxID=2847980 RepID=UPI000DB11C7C|nr:histidinol dehydrogenase [Synechococcus sp. CS-1324]MCT0231643.1 histidinol dehydrogenase [Synechococcus sp. CS-1324]PZV03605.1 MAG: histidinol dehydrogenase [Cyanobium sp.]